MKRFKKELHPKIRYYVYALVDPRNNQIFYIGKGKGDRVFDHEQEALSGNDSVNPEKNALIREIHDSGKEVIKYIIRWNLENEEALMLESVLIDLLSQPLFNNKVHLLNLIDGHDSAFNTQIPEDVELSLTTGDLDISKLEDNILAITVTESLKGEELYNRVRGNWNLSKERAGLSDFVFAVYDGVVIGIFKPKVWENMPADPGKENLRRNWVRFTGEEVKDSEIVEKYKGKKLPSKSKGNANPIQYLY